MFVQIQDYTLRVSTIYRYIQHLITLHITITLCRDKNISYEQTSDYTTVLILYLYSTCQQLEDWHGFLKTILFPSKYVLSFGARCLKSKCLVKILMIIRMSGGAVSRLPSSGSKLNLKNGLLITLAINHI